MIHNKYGQQLRLFTVKNRYKRKMIINPGNINKALVNYSTKITTLTFTRQQ